MSNKVNIMKLVLISFLIVLQSSFIFTQTREIRGVIKDIENDQPLPYCSVLILGEKKGVLANANGEFKIEIDPLNSYPRLIISTGEYITDTLLITPEQNDYLIYLKPKQEVLEEVVVTGVSKATLIRENPISIVNISTRQIELTTESNIIDVVVKNVPGVNAVKTGPNISKPFIRGLGYNRVLTLYDGIRQEGQQWGDEHSIEVDAYNIEKAEVIKDPASLMYGSDAVAGVVSLFPYIPNKGDGKLHGKFTSEYQTNNHLIGNGVRLDYSNKHFLFSVRGSYRIAKDYRNAIDGRVHNTGFDEKNLSALFGYKSDKGYSHINFTLYDNLQGNPDGSRDSLTRKFTKQIYEGNNDDIKNRPIVPDKELKSYQLPDLHQHIQHYRVYAHHFYQLGKGDIDLLVAFQQNIRREYNHPTMPKQAGMFVRLNTINYGLRYNAPPFANIETTIGINGMWQNNKNKDATNFPIPDYNLFDGGVYLYAKWKYNRWTISGGIRYDVREVKIKDFYVRTNPTTGFDEHTHFPDTTNATLQFPTYKKTFGGVSASLGMTFKVSEQISVKANVSRGYRAPNITEIASNGLDPGAHIIYLGNRNFESEFSLQEDVGISAKFKDITAELSFFNNNIQNYIYLSMLVDEDGKPINDAQGNRTYQYQQAAAQLFGMEAWFSIHPNKLKGFSFDNSFSIVYGFNRKYKNEGLNGEYLPLIPPLKLLSCVSHKFQPKSKVFKGITPKIEVEFNAAQNRYLGLNNTETFTASFTLLNIGISTEIKYSKTQSLQLQFQVNNIFDKAYQSNLSRLKYFEYYNQSSSGHSGMYNMGRNCSVKVIIPF